VGASLAFALALGTLVVLDRRLGRVPAPPDDAAFAPIDVLVDTILFSIFALHHSLMARTGLKTWLTRYVDPALERATYVWVASALFACVCLLWRPAPQILYQAGPPWSWLLVTVRLAGLWMTIDAASRIDPRELAGLRQAWTYGDGDRGPASGGGASSAGGRSDVDPGGPLVSGGGYRLVRHPLYLGWILMMWAAPTVTVGRLVFAAVSTAYLLLAIPFEERSLRERFGGAYRAYEAAVRWRVLPGLY
jgi:methanethiol S-methyltransferase